MQDLLIISCASFVTIAKFTVHYFSNNNYNYLRKNYQITHNMLFLTAGESVITLS